MKFFIQRVSEAKVEVDDEVVGSIGQGFLVFVGIGKDDDKEIADKYIKKLVGLRIFEDEEGKTNLSLDQVDGEILMISQFTLYANCKKGNRPSFVDAAKPDQAEKLYDYIVAETRKTGINVETGIFGADMKVSLVNDGPFTVDLQLT